jgi:hypothetical protein
VIKDLAYAWRQALFYLSMPDADPGRFVADSRLRLAAAGASVEGMLMPVLNGLDGIVRGARFDADGREDEGWQLLGWSTDGHWLRSRRRD